MVRNTERPIDPPTAAEVMALDALDVERRKAQRARDLEQRTQTLAYWRQRDARKVEQLRAIWAERDRQMAPIRRQQVFDCVCDICAHPYLMRRPPGKTERLLCHTCRKFIRLQKHRMQSRKHVEQRRVYAREIGTPRTRARRQALRDAQTNPVEATLTEPIVPKALPHIPRRRNEPMVVWTPSSGANL